MPIKFVGEPFCVSKKFWYRKVSSKGRGSFTVLSKFFLSHRTEKTSPGNHSVFQKISGREKYFMDKKGGGGETIFRRSFCLTVPKYFIGEHFGVSEKFFYRKFSCIGGGRGISRFCRNFLSHRTETKSFVKEPSCFPEIFWYRKKFMHKRGLITILSKFLCLTVPKIFVRESPTVFEKNSIKKKVLWMKRGVSRFSLENFLSHSTEKFRWGTLRCMRKLRVAKNFVHRRGGAYQVSSSKTFCHTVPKNFVREHFGVSKKFVHRKILCIRRGYH